MKLFGFIDRIVLSIHNILSRQRNDFPLTSTELLWRNINMAFHLHGRIGVTRAQKISMKIDVGYSGQYSVASMQQISNIPVEYLFSKSIRVTTETQSDIKFLNRMLWNVQDAESQSWQLYHIAESPIGNSNRVARWKETRIKEKENFQSEIAKEVFMSFDTSKSGFIEGTELYDLSLWTWENFYFGKPNPSGEELDEVLERLLYEMDKNREGKISLNNFTKWFSNLCDDVIKYQQSLSDSAPFLYRS